MGEFPSGQRGQTVNLLRFASMVRIRPPPPQKLRHQMVSELLYLRGYPIWRLAGAAIDRALGSHCTPLRKEWTYRKHRGTPIFLYFPVSSG